MSTLNPLNLDTLSPSFNANGRSRWYARFGQLFRWGNSVADASGSSDVATETTSPTEVVESLSLEDATPATFNGGGPRNGFLRRWSRRDDAITQLQSGVGALTDLMRSIQEHLERQSGRQDELMKHLSYLPTALQQFPESTRLQTEALQAIRQHIDRQTSQQSHVAEILERIAQADAEHGRALLAVQGRVDSLGQFEHAITENLSNVGSSIQSSASVLEQLKENLSARDSELERILHRQQNRFTAMLSVAIGLSIAVAGVVAIVGFAVMSHR